ncbi:ROK family protein [Cohnella nanjingensis]|uniref:ROK family protein n=1 Tax=Cohnella nanjingensis TaxID=1387779 RepID=A0A7X0RW78_9BACL|nr:ROK family protein [Cohnella nanjingensis]MBB6674735.1 ROK family protein [Cohnella nanjingensis]
MAATGYAIGVDIGGTKIQFAAIAKDGTILHRHQAPTEAQRGPEQIMAKVLAGIEHTREAMEASGAPAGIGIGSAGQIDCRTGAVVYASDLLPGWAGMPVKRHVEEWFGLSVRIDNDVNVFAIAEKVYGAGRNYNSFVCLALGTGIGGAMVEDGRLVRGAFGGAGELGHVSVDFEGPRCSCGNNGCVELYASGSGIARLGREALALASAAGEQAPDWRPESREIIRAWLAGEPLAAQVMDRALRALGAAIAGFIHTFNPEAVIIGGGVAEAGEPFLAALEEQVRTRTSAAMRDACVLLPAYVGADAGVIGAAAQIWHYGDE